jgi:hypothetical protein
MQARQQGRVQRVREKRRDTQSWGREGADIAPAILFSWDGPSPKPHTYLHRAIARCMRQARDYWHEVWLYHRSRGLLERGR